MTHLQRQLRGHGACDHRQAARVQYRVLCDPTCFTNPWYLNNLALARDGHVPKLRVMPARPSFLSCGSLHILPVVDLCAHKSCHVPKSIEIAVTTEMKSVFARRCMMYIVQSSSLRCLNVDNSSQPRLLPQYDLPRVFCSSSPGSHSDNHAKNKIVRLVGTYPVSSWRGGAFRFRLARLRDLMCMSMSMSIKSSISVCFSPNIGRVDVRGAEPDPGSLEPTAHAGVIARCR